jgi:hypothetical protein
MPRTRGCPTLALFVALLALAGCGKKPDPAPEPAPAPQPEAQKPGEPKTDPAAEADRQAREEAKKRLREIGKAMHEFEGTWQFFPAGVVGPKGELGLSWRVQLLPHLGEGALYKQFKLDEPWDSPANKPLVEKMPTVFASPGKPAPPGHTYLRAFVGESAIIPAPPVPPKGAPAPPPNPGLQPGFPARGRQMATIPDGTSGTLVAAEAAEPVVWTKPDELPFRGFPGANPPIAVPKLGGPFPDGFHGLMGDGQVWFFPATVSEKFLREVITVNGGEVLGEEFEKVMFPKGRPVKKLPPSDVPADLPDRAARLEAVGRLQSVAVAALQFQQGHGHLPAGVSAKGGVLGVSWRVQLLPYLGEAALYKQFKLDEPWDSEHNKKLLEKVPKVFESPGKAAPPGHTYLRTTEGPAGMIPYFHDQKRLQLREPGLAAEGRRSLDRVDGSSSTILVVEAAESVPWTKPGDLPLQGDAFAKGPKGSPGPAVPKLGGPFPDGFHAAMADGRVTFYKTGYPDLDVFRLLTPAGGEVVEALGEPEKIAYSIAPRPVPPPK